MAQEVENDVNENKVSSENELNDYGMIEIIRKRDFEKGRQQIESMVHTVLSTINITKLPFFVIDIHNTTEFDNDANGVKVQQIDDQVFELIETLDSKKYSFLFLSYDGNEARMFHNAKFLSQHSPLLTKANKIFIKQRDKGMILHIIDQYIQKSLELNADDESNNSANIVFIDDNPSNIENASNYFTIGKDLIAFNYSKHNKHHNADNDFSEIYKLFKL